MKTLQEVIAKSREDSKSSSEIKIEENLKALSESLEGFEGEVLPTENNVTGLLYKDMKIDVTTWDLGYTIGPSGIAKELDDIINAVANILTKIDQGQQVRGATSTKEKEEKTEAETAEPEDDTKRTLFQET